MRAVGGGGSSSGGGGDDADGGCSDHYIITKHFKF